MVTPGVFALKELEKEGKSGFANIEVRSNVRVSTGTDIANIEMNLQMVQACATGLHFYQRANIYEIYLRMVGKSEEALAHKWIGKEVAKRESWRQCEILKDDQEEVRSLKNPQYIIKFSIPKSTS